MINRRARMTGENAPLGMCYSVEFNGETTWHQKGVFVSQTIECDSSEMIYTEEEQGLQEWLEN